MCFFDTIDKFICLTGAFMHIAAIKLLFLIHFRFRMFFPPCAYL